MPRIRERKEIPTLGAVTCTVRQHEQGLRSLKHHKDEQLYHGPLVVPQEVIDKIDRRYHIYRTTHGKVCARIKHKGIVYIFRTLSGRQYIGEVVRTQKGDIRVHLWSATDRIGRVII